MSLFVFNLDIIISINLDEAAHPISGQHPTM